MKVILCDVNHKSIYSRIISLVTQSHQTHSMVQVETDEGPKIYDTTLRRGYFGIADTDILNPNRMVTVFDVNVRKPMEWIKEHIGDRYDLFGVLGWPLNIDDPTKMYCFEATAKLLEHEGYVIPKDGNRLSAPFIEKALIDLGYVGTRMRLKNLL